MKQIGSLLLIVFAGTLCSQPAPIDPYFVRSYDTISQFGPECITRNILEDRKGNIWLATWQGIVKYDGIVFTNYTLKDGLRPFHVFSIFEDSSHNIWFGTVKGGAYKYKGTTFTLYTTYDGLADNLIGCIMEDKLGNIWLGTDGGLTCLDTFAAQRAKEKVNFVTLPGLPLNTKKGITNYTRLNGLCGDRINSIIQDKGGLIWIATRSGLCYFDGKTFSDFKIDQNLPFANVRCIKEDRQGRIWIGGQEGLYCYDPLNKDEIKLTKLMPNFIGFILEDREGNLWLSAGENKGMALYKYDGKNFSKVIDKNTYGDSQVFEICEDKNGNIWFGTMHGPCRYDGKTFTYFSK